MMNAWGLYGHDWAVEHLQRSIINGRARHAYLFMGGDRIGKTTLALAFAKTMNCEVWREQAPLDPRPCGVCSSCLRIDSGNHPDIARARHDPDTGTLRIEEIREVAGRLSLRPFEARFRVALFIDFDQAKPQAQDALLKTLEEPSRYAMLLLTTTEPELVLPTITSRSQVVRLRPVAVDDVRAALTDAGAPPSDADLIARLSGGRIGWALEAWRKPEVLQTRAQALDLLDEIIGGSRAHRFALAEDLAKEKSSLSPLLALWQTYWRDLVLHKVSGVGAPLVNIDRIAKLELLASRIPVEAALNALKSTRELMRLLTETNTQPRLALEAAFLDYPIVR
ncbi:MAG: DNA polymerase III subunit [Chloroflexota bacterium]|nr:DNA polymerase III subunit [Chloroflexota bacterium]